MSIGRHIVMKLKKYGAFRHTVPFISSRTGKTQIRVLYGLLLTQCAWQLHISFVSSLYVYRCSSVGPAILISCPKVSVTLSPLPFVFICTVPFQVSWYCYEGHPESKEHLSIQSMHLFCCSQSLVSGVQCEVVKLLMQLYVRRPCHMVSAETAVAMAVLTENPADCEVRGVNSFSAGQWDLRLSCRRGKLSHGTVLFHDNAYMHTARQTQALMCEQFHWDIFEHPPYSPDLAPSDFFLFPKMEHLSGKIFAND